MSYTNAQCAHIWAQQEKDKGQTNNSNMFFEGKTIYSYGYHFPLATFLDENTVLINDSSYSISTSGHQSDVRLSIDYNTTRRIFAPTNVIKPIVDNGFSKLTQENLQEWALTSAKSACKSAIKRRAAHLKESDYKEAVNYIDTALELIAYFKKRPSVMLGRLKERILNDKETLQEHFKSEMAKEKKRQEAAKRKEQKRLKALHAEALENFRAGKPFDRRYIQWTIDRDFINHDLLRIKGDLIETSGHATFPIEHGIKAWPLIKACKDQEKDFYTNGKEIRLGHFKIDHIDTQGNVKAGCHNVMFEEIENIAKELNL